VSLLSDLREQLAERITDLDLEDVANVYAYPPRNPSLPCALILPGDPYIDNHIDMARANATVNLVVRLMVTASATESAGVALDDLLTGSAATSIIDALEGSYPLTTPLAGSAHGVEVVNFAAGVTTVADVEVEALSCDLLVTAHISRSA